MVRPPTGYFISVCFKLESKEKRCELPISCKNRFFEIYGVQNFFSTISSSLFLEKYSIWCDGQNDSCKIKERRVKREREVISPVHFESNEHFSKFLAYKGRTVKRREQGFIFGMQFEFHGPSHPLCVKMKTFLAREWPGGSQLPKTGK